MNATKKAKLESHLTGTWEDCGELRYTEEQGPPVTVRATFEDGEVFNYYAVNDTVQSVESVAAPKKTQSSLNPATVFVDAMAGGPAAPTQVARVGMLHFPEENPAVLRVTRQDGTQLIYCLEVSGS